MPRGQGIDLGLTAYAELFMDDASREEAKLPRIYDIPLSEIDDFPEHPFQVKLDEDMDQLVESICDNGIITPVTLRQKEDGRYEMIAGHRRKKACEIAGFETIKAEIRDLTRDESIILMVESNLQRSTILPSEKAFSYKMRLEAMKRRAGRPSSQNSVPVGQNFGKTSREIIAANSSDSNTQIQRYIRLTYLIKPLLDMVDEGQIALRPAVELSYLNDIEQRDLIQAMEINDCTPSLSQAVRMKKLSQQALTKYRQEVDTTSRKDRSIKITDRQWEAIQAGAISETKLNDILKNTDVDVLRERATPRTSGKSLSSAQVNRMKRLADSNYTLNEIASKMNVSPATVSKYLKGAN